MSFPSLIVDGSGSPSSPSVGELAQRHLIMHFTPNSMYQTSRPRVIVRGSGSQLWDETGQRYIDGLAGMFCVQIGYSFGEEIGAAITAQLKEIPFYMNWSAATPPAVALAARLASLAPPGLERVFFTSSGSEANEAAIKLARQFHQARGEYGRQKFIARRNAYHGTSYGALSLNGITRLRSRFEPLMPGVRHVSNTTDSRSGSERCGGSLANQLLNELEAAIRHEGPDTVAGVILEPVQNSGGCLVPPPGYADGVREICDRYGMLLIADEVVTGFGRLGAWFGSDVIGFRPDVITFAKGVTSGYAALGGLICKDDVFETVLSGPDEMYLHGGTFGGNPASCAAALANMDVIEREGLLARVRNNGTELGRRLRDLLDHPLVHDVRGMGYQYAVEIARDQKLRGWTSSVDRSTFAHQVIEPGLLKRGLLCRVVANDPDAAILIQIAPPLVITDEEVDQMLDAIRSGLDESWETLLRLESACR